MNATTIETIIQTDGELHLSHLPFRKGDRVEAVISARTLPENESGDQEKEKARQLFLALARQSTFCSIGPYPNRDELHERH